MSDMSGSLISGSPNGRLVRGGGERRRDAELLLSMDPAMMCPGDELHASEEIPALELQGDNEPLSIGCPDNRRTSNRGREGKFPRSIDSNLQNLGCSILRSMARWMQRERERERERERSFSSVRYFVCLAFILPSEREEIEDANSARVRHPSRCITSLESGVTT